MENYILVKLKISKQRGSFVSTFCIIASHFESSTPGCKNALNLELYQYPSVDMYESSNLFYESIFMAFRKVQKEKTGST